MVRTGLYHTHVAMGGRMVEFAGWELPVQYPTGPLAEHHAVRQAAGLFDIDHMGQFEVRGPDALAFLQRVQVYDVATMAPFEAHYSMLLYQDGTLVDDIFIYRLPERWLVIVNAGNRKKDLAWLEVHAQGYDLSLIDMSDDLYMMALQGPAAAAILQPLVPDNLDTFATRTALETTLLEQPVVIGRTGYTGEDGFELFVDVDRAGETWDALMEAGRAHGLIPVGLGARDTLRLEAGMPLYGNELGRDTNPYEAGLGRVVKLAKPGDFVGRAALEKVEREGVARRLVGLVLRERGIARHGYPVLNADGPTGTVTSGTMSPTRGVAIAMAYVAAADAEPGTMLAVEIRGARVAAEVVPLPFYKRPS